MKRINGTYISLLPVLAVVLSTPAPAPGYQDCNLGTSCPSCQPQEPLKAQQANGVQRATIIIEEHGFSPATVKVALGVPADLTFLRSGLWDCSGQIFIEELHVLKFIETGQKVTVRFTPTKAGVIPFSCATGKLKGQIVVK